MKPYFPMFVSLEDKRILVVGAGTIATRRIKALMKFGASIRVVAPLFDPELEGIEDLDLINRGFIPGDLDDTDMVVIATNNAPLNEEIAEMCESRGIIKNVSSNQKLCDFFFPATILTDDIIVGICSGGNDPSVTKNARADIENFLKNRR